MECQECGALASEDDLFCGECGAVLPNFPTIEAAVEPAVDSLPEPTIPPPPAPVSFPRAAGDSRANAAFILGIISIGMLVFSCLPFVGFFSCLTPVVGVVAIVLGNMAKRDIETRGGPEQDRKRAHQGMVMGIVGTALYAALIVVGVLFGLGISILSEM